jgi:hypothetical protein
MLLDRRNDFRFATGFEHFCAGFNVNRQLGRNLLISNDFEAPNFSLAARGKIRSETNMDFKTFLKTPATPEVPRLCEQRKCGCPHIPRKILSGDPINPPHAIKIGRLLTIGLLACSILFGALAAAAADAPVPVAPPANPNAAAGTTAVPDQLSVSTQRTTLGLACVATVAALIAIGVAAFALFKYSKKPADSGARAEPVSDEFFRSRLAWLLTTGALLFVGVVASLALLSAGVNALVYPTDKKTTEFFDIIKYVLTGVLPVVAGWVGTVLAFYFGKANFEAATKNAKDIATALSSNDKLAATPVRLLGKPKSEITLHQLNTTDPATAAKVTLDVIEAAFTKNGVTRERLPVLFSNDVPHFVLHRSVLNDFLQKQNKTNPPANPPKQAKDYTLAELFTAEPWLLGRSFVTVGLNATASEAKEKMEQVKECTDVLVTNDGTPQSAMTRWFTNLDLLKAAEV